jgi:hypothetical protein
MDHTPASARPRVVAALPAGFYYPRLRAAGALLAAVVAACAPGRSPPAAAPAALDAAVVDSVEQATALHRPQHITFDWALTDRDARFSGKGVVRLAPPRRARLDLFGPRGEAYVIGVMDGEDFRLRPEGAAEMLPPPAFLWASLGVFRRPDEPLSAVRRSDGALELTFAGGSDRWRFSLGMDGLRQVEWQGPDGGRRTVELTGRVPAGLPQRGTYRDWLAFRELTLTVTGVETVDGFADDIWNLDAR